MDPVLLKQLLSVYQEPSRLSDASAWFEHIPFAFVLVELLQPRVFVELGTHKGDSYLAFCQALKGCGIACKAYAVDTWSGEEHSGRYSAEILARLQAYHDPLYGDFSSLVRATFDDALARFADGSVDLLHIDGLHTYQAVRHDFDSWLPKMSAAGVVLLHDTTVRERDFGVWRLWEEISRAYPSFEFTHGFGLGVVAVGDAVPAALGELFSADTDAAALVRKCCSLLGSRVALKALVAEYERQLAEKDQQLFERALLIEQVVRSRSWKITKPLRSLNDLLLLCRRLFSQAP